ncbi:histidinol-phosphate transaminase [Pelagicoccus sp. SDUM812005]|uniref:pyridoxal phosphate-dependent aminotransferase n=1 Tax=Pelagicoccus sp. SDUM812005 TaxID=3041257 RepID=UPI00280E589E|nr:histidinol-phosphate transaminase [Pelagicoccus sp. SDUM812005]MDQ8182385.1 histidinol-phosphate transaminase [Pelagicoccus sp. SDUM812005]
MKKMSTLVERRIRGWVVPAALAGTLLTSSLVGQAAPTLEDSPVRLSSNENAFGYTPKAKMAMMKALDGGSYYNRNNVSELEELCAKKEGVSTDYILTTAGSGPLLMMTALAYAEPGVNVVTTEMGYTQLVRKFEQRGGDVKFAPLSEDMGYDFKALKAAIDENTKIVYICNPNNPTGVLADSAELKQFVMSIPDDILVFVDEAYLELTSSSFAMATCAPLARLKKNVIVTRTFSKGYGLAGFRIGYAVAHPDILEKISVFHMGAPSYIAAIAACEAIKDSEHLAVNIKNYQTVRKYVTDAFDKMGIEYAKPDGAFVYFHSGIDQQLLRDTMRENGILISGSRVSGAPESKYADWARVSIGTKPQMDEFLTLLSGLVAKK